MIQERQIRELAEEGLKDTGNFLVDVQVRPGNRILVQVDGPNGITIHDCVKVSRHIEFSLDREKEDFDLEVSSPGADRPFKVFEQYQKYTGKKVEVITEEGKKIIGVLEAADKDRITVVPEPDKKSKGKKTETEPLTLNMSEVKQTRAVISFK